MAISNQPKRRESPKTHLDASTVPVERAYLARAEVLSSEAMRVFAVLGPERNGPGMDPDWRERIEPSLKLMLAAEFRALAEELHYW